ncbi:TonB-dependent receptor [Rhizorhabdus wittichii]|uniref:TonB-dependent receptor n=1 Tax=Rhizorhabdus wittichii TaxID=160791 RepID=UPI0003768613|nr:TonB-dependent receptor [Rhizorhabdus wittichii]
MKVMERASLFALAAALGSGQLWAGQAGDMPSGGSVAAADGASEGLAEIVVTAQRKSENLQKAAIAIASVGGDTLRSAGVVNPAQLTALVPSLQVSNGNGAYANFYIRGVGNFTGNALTESAIAFNYDGVYVARPSSTSGFFYDLERVEVLKGPQGTLYGRNATGGAINVLPRQPQFEWGGHANASYGNYDAVNLEGAINAPLAPDLAVRLTGIYNRHDGYMKDGTDDQKEYGGRLQLRYEPTSELSILIGADYFHQGGKGPGGTLVPTGIDKRYGNFSPQADAYYAGLQHVVGGTTFSPLPNIQYQDNTYWGVNARINYATDFGTFTIIPAYRSSKLDYVTGNIGFFILQKEKFRQQTLEARYASPDSLPVQALVGGYYFRERGRDPYNIINNQFGFVDQFDQRYGTTSAAAFGRLTYAVTPDVHLTGGLRYTHERKKYSGQTLALTRVCLAGFAQCQGQAVPFPNTIVPPTVTVLPDTSVVPDFTSFGAFPFQVGQFGTLVAQDKSKSFNKVTWRAGADWTVTPGSLLYVSYETGYKSGGFYATRDAGIYRPETIRAWTIGSKNRFFGNRLQVNLEAFYWKYKDQQISHLGVDSANALIFPTENIGRSTLKGVEADIQYLLTPTTLLNADIQYLSAKYDRFVYTTPAAGGTPQTGCAVSPIATGFSVDCSGFRPPQSPAWSINLGLTQTFELGSGAKIVFDGRAHYQSRTLTSLEFLDQEYQDGYLLGDLQLTYHDPSDRFTVAGFVNNVGDKTVKGQTYLVTYAAVPTASAILRPPRTYGVRLGYNF